MDHATPPPLGTRARTARTTNDDGNHGCNYFSNHIHRHRVCPRRLASFSHDQGADPRVCTRYPRRARVHHTRAPTRAIARDRGRKTLDKYFCITLARVIAHHRAHARDAPRSPIRNQIIGPGRRNPNPIPSRVERTRASNTYLLPCGFQTIMDLALVTLPVETATVLATCAEAWVTADISDSKRAGYDARGEPPFERSSVASRVRSRSIARDRSNSRSIELAIDRTRDRNIDRVWVCARVRIQYQSHPQLRQCRGPLLAVASRAMASGSRA